MERVFLRNCEIDKSLIMEVIALGVFGSYHEKCFIEGKSDIDIMILTKNQLDFDREFEIEDYLDSILKEYFNYDTIHYTFLNEFVYPYGEILLTSNDKVVFREEEYLDYTLGYSCFKRDREYLEIMREENLKDLER